VCGPHECHKKLQPKAMKENITATESHLTPYTVAHDFNRLREVIRDSDT
jgi:hypothetical protein